MNNLFYSEKDKRLFWISGYQDDSFVSLQSKVKDFMEFTGCELKDVNTFKVIKSRRYLHMQIFYLNNTVFKEGCYNLQDLDMFEWIENT